MALSKEAQSILDSLKKLSVMDLAELVKSMEEEFGVSAAAPVAVAATPAAGAAAPAEQKSEFDINLKEAGANKIAVIKVIRDTTGLGLTEAKELAEKGGSVKKAVKADEAKKIQEKFVEAGAKVELV